MGAVKIFMLSIFYGGRLAEKEHSWLKATWLNTARGHKGNYVRGKRRKKAEESVPEKKLPLPARPETNALAFDKKKILPDKSAGSSDEKSPPDLGAFGAVAAHFYLTPGLQQGLAEILVGQAVP